MGVLSPCSSSCCLRRLLLHTILSATDPSSAPEGPSHLPCLSPLGCFASPPPPARLQCWEKEP